LPAGRRAPRNGTISFEDLIMLTTPIITDDQIEAFGRDGYLVLRQGFGATDMALIDTWTHELLAMPEESGRHWVFHENSLKGDGRNLVSRIENIAPLAADLLPIESLHGRANRLLNLGEIALFEAAVGIAHNLVYDGSIYSKSILVVQAGAELYWQILRYAHLNDHADLLEFAGKYISLVEHDARLAGSKFVTLLSWLRLNAVEPSAALPLEYPDDIEAEIQRQQKEEAKKAMMQLFMQGKKT